MEEYLAKLQGLPPPPVMGGDGIPGLIRLLSIEDLRKACQEVSSTVAAERTRMRELVELNKQSTEYSRVRVYCKRSCPSYFL
jgi:hypothetical protein